MRIERLSLDFFGHFTGKALDFGKSGQGSDFHLIYGPNEAGKTTTMEAYLRLLYGFPHREPYAFQHQRQNLRVSGLLDTGGETHLFTRLPSRSGNLRGAADAALPETAIASHLGGLSLEDYRNLLCLDDDTIEKGGEDIANAQGDIGRLLFSAAAGVADLNAVLEQARTEAGRLYKKRASTTRVAELKRELVEIDSAIRDMDVSANAWRKLRDALDAARGEEASARDGRDALRAEQAHVAALRRALPCLAELDRLMDEVAEFADYPDKIDINPEKLVTMMTERAQAEAELERLQRRLDSTETALAALVLDEDRLALGEQLDSLDEQRSRMQTAVSDLPRRRRALEDALTDMTHLAQDLGAPAECDVTRLVTSPSEIAMLEDLRDKMREAGAAREAGAQEITALSSRMAEAEEALGALQDAPPAQTGLIDLLARFDADALAPDVAAARQAIASADVARCEALDTLTVGTCRFDTLPDCPIDPSTAADLAARHADLTEHMTRAADREAQFDEDIAAMEAKIAHLSNSLGVASDDEARAACTRRDTLWQGHRDALTAQSADLFAPAMRRVDEIEAARLAHATEIGELRKLDQDAADARARVAKSADQRERHGQQAHQIEAQVNAVTTAIGLPVLSPAAFSDWTALHAKALFAERKRDALARRHQDTLDRAERLRQRLLPLVVLEDPGFDAALSSARRLAQTERDHLDAVRTASDRLTALKDDLDRRKRAQRALNDAAEHAAAAWVDKVRTVFGDLLLPERLAAAPGLLRDLRENDAKRMQAERQVTTMQDDQRRFADAMATLAAGFGIKDSDPLEVFRHLRDVAQDAQAARTRHEELGAALHEDKRHGAELIARLEDIDRVVADLGAVFPRRVETGTLGALRIAVGTARDVIAQRRRIAELERTILDELSLHGIDEARALIAGQTAPALEARMRTLEADLEPAEDRLSSATVARANAERDLASVTGSAEVAEQVERRATVQMQIEEAILDYLQWDLGLGIAEEAIRRYRDRHRSEMMAATEMAFAALTNGAYHTLLTQPDGASEILLAVDAGGTPKQIGDMSKGTRFQLYLALRAAAYEQMVAQGVQLPFFCDDVFETFDEDRTRAACRLMERIGRSGQAIYLTHHRHVVDIATEVCDAPPMIHDLE